MKRLKFIQIKFKKLILKKNFEKKKKMSQCRVVLIGDAFVGKTALIQRFISKEIQQNYDETVGAAFHSFTTTVNGQQENIQVWDTAGQEKYRSLGPVYYRNASSAILVFDVTERSSFNDLEEWINTFRSAAGDGPPIVIVGNKVDLEESKVVEEQEATTFAEKHDLTLFFTSAKTGYNVDFLFQKISSLAVEYARKPSNTSVARITEKKEKNRSSCC